MYMMTKGLYLLNTLLQIYFLNKFLKTDQNDWYGLRVIQEVMNGTDWGNTGVFPRVSVCDFSVWQVGNILRYSAQCVLVINMFNEKIFVFLWFWYMLLAAATVLSFTYWLIIIIIPCFSRWFISQSLELSDMKFDPSTKKKEVERFVSTYLRHDGIFILRMVTIHAGVIFGTDLVLSLWNAFYSIEEEFSEGRTSNEDRYDNKQNYLRQRKKQRAKKLINDLEPCTALMPTQKSSDTDRSSNDER
uniref:Innexin n=1 Tax=Syphacia muris TaxID=451379 RepID=A0A0N5AYT1_9BILA